MEKLTETAKDNTLVSVGQLVTHKTFGEGLVKAIVDGRIIIAFGNSEKVFVYPDAFKMGYLSMK